MRRYRILVADNPWKFGDKLQMQEGKIRRGAEANYPVLDIGEMKRLRVERLMEDDAVGLMWFPDALLGEARDVFAAWGFRQTQLWTWVKTGKDELRLGSDDVPEDLKMAFGMGRLARNCCEHALVGVRGSVYEHVVSHSERNVFLAPSMPHSKKPELVQDALDRLVPAGHRLELFARRDRPNWTCIGDEAPRTAGRDIRSALAELATIPF